MYTLIIFAPIIIFLLISIFGKRMGGYYTALGVCISTFFSCILAFDAFLFELYSSFAQVYYLPVLDLLKIYQLSISWHFYFDTLTVSMFLLITLVSFFIQIFSISYIGEDASHVRFIFYLCFFMIAILLLVGSSNFLQLFFGWELVGLASFLLINFWFSRQDANISAFKAVGVNRFGDCFLLFSIFLFLYEFHTVEFDLIQLMVSADSYTSLFAVTFLILGSFAKSAQFFFHTWLPDAMEGPTPVSALLHSATMVTAGVFLTLRFLETLEIFSQVRYFVVFFGLLTALYAISIAAVADDTKRVTAYTTLNQLGFIFFGCGSLAGATVLFHLIIHGFYKSFSFLSAAMELYDLEDEQDGESEGLDTVGYVGLYDFFTIIVFFSVNAIPFTSPSISKEFMLLSGIENLPSYFTYIVTLILFSGAIDEGRDDSDAFDSGSHYFDDLYVSSAFPYPMVIGCFGLGLISLISSTFLEELFIDMNFYWSIVSPWHWLDVKGSMLIFMPFMALLLSEFDTSHLGKIEDVNNNSVISRQDDRYLTVNFNSELWHYDELSSKLSTNFLKISFYFSSFVMDKGYLESVYVRSFFTFFSSSLTNFFYSGETLILFASAAFGLSIVLLVYAPWFYFVLFFLCFIGTYVADEKHF
jgi:NADH:ubiquinone oxidoreductase subunit 5 (subunit L)/multisubunit Na+/H+ antiporter MnhA subunit